LSELRLFTIHTPVRVPGTTNGRFRLGCVMLVLFVASAAISQEAPSFFYKALPYGTQAQYNPLTVVSNGSFDILQVSNRNNTLTGLPLSHGFTNVWRNVTHPWTAIREYGWRRFLDTEVLPGSLRLRNAQYWPNYQLHLIGGGITYVATAEWYAYHGCPWPKTLSVLTMGFYHFLNEAVENGSYTGLTVDPIADMLLFDPLGILLFSIDGVPAFFSHTLHASDWSFQPIVALPGGSLVNNGQNFVFKVGIPWADSWKIFYLTGMEGGLGVSWRCNESDDVSVSGGLSTRELVELDSHTEVRALTATLVWTVGLYYDRNNSLLASLMFGGGRGYLCRANVYPGVVNLLGLRVGGAILIEPRTNVTLGITFSGFPAGLGLHTR
jgi:hypothetical protein